MYFQQTHVDTIEPKRQDIDIRVTRHDVVYPLTVFGANTFLFPPDSYWLAALGAGRGAGIRVVLVGCRVRFHGWNLEDLFFFLGGLMCICCQQCDV